ncbi:MAG: Rieske (2Fe-2S) protein [Actinomycetota bacterium]|nr:Rieske (2Fe-2S) protein [Actinomycetota bacterium]
MSAPFDISRRAMLAGLGGGMLAVSGCGSEDAAAPEPSGASGNGGTADSPAGPLAAVTDIPEGGAVIVASGGRSVVLARNAADEVTGYDARCTHQGCTVKVEGKELGCPCHGSRFDALTGEVLREPARRPLAKVDVAVENGQIRLA